MRFATAVSLTSEFRRRRRRRRLICMRRPHLHAVPIFLRPLPFPCATLPHKNVARWPIETHMELDGHRVVPSFTGFSATSGRFFLFSAEPHLHTTPVRRCATRATIKNQKERPVLGDVGATAISSASLSLPKTKRRRRQRKKNKMSPRLATSFLGGFSNGPERARGS